MLAFALWGCFPLLLVVEQFGGSGIGSAGRTALVVFTGSWWAAVLGLAVGLRWARLVAPALAALPLLFGLGQSIRRVGFILDRASLEPADGGASPLAFLLGWGQELVLLLVPGLILTVAGVMILGDEADGGHE